MGYVAGIRQALKSHLLYRRYLQFVSLFRPRYEQVNTQAPRRDDRAPTIAKSNVLKDRDLSCCGCDNEITCDAAMFESPAMASTTGSGRSSIRSAESSSSS